MAQTVPGEATDTTKLLLRMGQPLRLNAYTYAQCNPTNSSDPDGRCDSSDVTTALVFQAGALGLAEGAIAVATVSVLDPVVPIVGGSIMAATARAGYTYCYFE